MSLKHTLKESLTFSKKERLGAIVLVPCILSVALLPFYSKQPVSPVSPADSMWLAAAENIQERDVTGHRGIPHPSPDTAVDVQSDVTAGHYHSTVKGVLFNFDPNTLDAAGFKKLGLRDKTIRTLLNYRNKGGKFRKPDDLARVYGLRPEEFQRLRPYILVSPMPVSDNHFNTGKNDQTAGSSIYPRASPARHVSKPIEINTADIAGFESLHGIGNKLANKIVNFRDKLGGFYSIEQVGETYGIPDSTFGKIKSRLTVNPGLIRKLDINSATYDELNAHPYISSRLAYLIMKQRKEKGPIVVTEELTVLISQTTDSYERVSRYLSLPAR
ncbi:helix-hairpin-helix domain-containing protein [Spirosoma sp.]|uniref:helix-hairpin-helix domain-containing protein n=1 Tax=Spirosoma sp. TaxID=1899569 RepID=UPI003B3A7F51